MRLYLIICAVVLASCGSKGINPPPLIPADLVVPETGWAGSVPKTEQQLILAAKAERDGRIKANRKLKTIAEIIAP